MALLAALCAALAAYGCSANASALVMLGVYGAAAMAAISSNMECAKLRKRIAALEQKQ